MKYGAGNTCLFQHAFDTEDDPAFSVGFAAAEQEVYSCTCQPRSYVDHRFARSSIASGKHGGSEATESSSADHAAIGDPCFVECSRDGFIQGSRQSAFAPCHRMHAFSEAVYLALSVEGLP